MWQEKNSFALNSIGEKAVKTVHVKVEFIRIGKIDNMREKYYAEINFEATWIEKQIITTYDPNIYWNPMIYIENLLIKRTSSVSYSLQHLDESTSITEIQNIKGIR